MLCLCELAFSLFQLSGYLESNCEVFGAAMEQNAARQTDSQVRKKEPE